MDINSREGLPSDTVLSVIVNDIQPYENGKLGLYGLHSLDITDKHHILNRAGDPPALPGRQQ